MTSPHPDSKDLLLLHSGELDGPKAALVKDHLRGCRECRDALDELESVFSRIADAGEQAAVWNFQARRKNRSTSRSLWAAAAAAIAAGVAIVFAVVTFTRITPTAHAESLLTAAVRHADRQSRSGLTVSLSSAGKRCRIPVDRSDFCLAAAARFESVGWSWAEPLAARNFQKWRGALYRKKDSVQEDRQTIAITTETTDGPLRRATIRLNAGDYQPVAGHFQFVPDSGSPEEFDLVQSEEPVKVTLGDPVSGDASTVSAVQPHAGEPSFPDSLHQAEARVRIALHDAGLDSNPLIAVISRDQDVHVWGAAPDAAVKDVLESSLRGIPHVRMAVTAGAEQQGSLGPLPWQAFHGDGLPLGYERVNEHFYNDPRGRQDLLNTLDSVTRRLVGLARSREGLLRLVGQGPGSPYSEHLKMTASMVEADIRVGVTTLRRRLELLLRETPEAYIAAGPLTYAEAAELYILIHEVAFSGKADSPTTLDGAVARIRVLLGDPKPAK